VSGRDPIDADEEWVEVQDTGPERNLRVERRDPIDVLRDALLEGEHCLNALWEVKDALRKLPDDLAKKINEVDFEEALEALAVLERQLAAAPSDPDYSPAFQHEYQRLWHEASARAVAAEAALAEANQRADGNLLAYEGALGTVERANQQARNLADALRELDGPYQWLADNYQAALEAMPTELYAAFAAARAALDRHTSSDDEPPAPDPRLVKELNTDGGLVGRHTHPDKAVT
jgi:hypothetical protein